MTATLRHRISLGLFLLLLLPVSFYEVRYLIAPVPQQLNPATLHTILIGYQLQLEQRLAKAVSRVQEQGTLAPEFRTYWQKVLGTWQSNRRIPPLADMPCPPPPGRLIAHAVAQKTQLYLCMEQQTKKQLFLLNVSALLAGPPALESLSLALIDPQQRYLYWPDPRSGDLLSTPMLGHSPSQPVGQSTNTIQPVTLPDSSHVTTTYGWLLVLQQHHTSQPWQWVWLIVTLTLCMLLSWSLSAWISAYIFRRLRYLTQAAAQIALGNFSFRLPLEHQDELALINTVFNRMLDEIQIQKQRLQEQNEALQAGNESLRETLETVQNMQSERFVKASAIVQHAESQILRQLLKWPVQQMTELGHQLLRQQEQLDSLMHQTAIDRSQLYRTSQQCLELLQQCHSQLQQTQYLLDETQPDASRSELGEKQSIQLAPLLQETIHRLMPYWQPYGHIVYVRCPTSITLDSYPLAIGQVITNLVMNALHHGFAPSFAGEIIISAKQDAGSVTIICRDNGCGIPEKRQHKLFQPFLNTNGSSAGNSLGLYLTRQLVRQLLHGTIIYQPTESPGACFIITLPLEVVGEQRGI